MFDEPNIIHLGNGLYAETDGIGVWLSIGEPKGEYSTKRIYLEADMMERLIKFYRMCMGE